MENASTPVNPNENANDASPPNTDSGPKITVESKRNKLIIKLIAEYGVHNHTAIQTC